MEIHSIPLLAPGTYSGVGVQNLGVAILSQALQSAHYTYTATVLSIESSEYCKADIAFMEGEGLRHTIASFGLPYSPEHLRELFHNLQ